MGCVTHRPLPTLLEHRIDVEQAVIPKAETETLGDIVDVCAGVEDVRVLADQQQAAPLPDEPFEGRHLLGGIGATWGL